VRHVAGRGGWFSASVKTVEHRHQIAFKTRAEIMPPTTTIASGRWVCDPILVDMAAGKRPKIAVRAVIIIGRTRFSAPAGWTPGAENLQPHLVEVRDCQQAVHDATPKIEMNPTAAEMLKLVSVINNAKRLPKRERMTLVDTIIASRKLRNACTKDEDLASEIGTTNSRRVAASISSNSPLHTARYGA